MHHPAEPPTVPEPAAALVAPDPRRESRAHSGPHAAAIERAAARVEEGLRLTPEEGLLLHDHADLGTLGRLADLVRWRLHPRPVVTYVVDRNLNPTNVCVTDCGFCAFYRRPKHEEAYVLPRETIHAKMDELRALGGRQVLMQGGHHPYLKSAWWCELLADLAARYPEINLHALSAPEIDHLARLEKRPVEDVIADLAAAGLGSVPGAGAEMLVERVRRIIAPKKTSTDRWLDVHRKVHAAGLRSSATMMFGHVETGAERIEHLERLRALQDETGGFTAFACWTLQPDGVPEQHLYPERATPGTYLRVQALSRIYLDNFENVQTSYVTQGLKMAQITLRFGCNDFGGTMMEENVVSAAGCFHLSPLAAIEQQIVRAGLVPRQRNSWYGIVDARHDEARDGPRGPLSRAEGATHRAAPAHATHATPRAEVRA
ncbi:MAG: dehypoxanthine futalosine cyclase [Planctomycetes bacterium]|nr:dehypoxanthine futalosine cyclase [Planctomycetota bacterium]